MNPTFLLIAVVGFIALVLAVLIAALVSERLESRRVAQAHLRKDLDSSTFVRRFYPSLADRTPKIEFVLRELVSAMRLGIPSGKLRPTDRFDDLWRLSRDPIQGTQNDRETSSNFFLAVSGQVDRDLANQGLPHAETIDELLKSLFMVEERTK